MSSEIKSTQRELIIKCLKDNYPNVVKTEELIKLFDPDGKLKEPVRVIRSVRDYGYIMIYNKEEKGYYLEDINPAGIIKDTAYISKKLRAQVEIRDNGTCQLCGRNVRYDKIKVHIDHVIPRDWGGKTELSNLQVLCSECNDGKKAWVDSENPDLMIEVSKQTSAVNRLKVYFEYYPNTEISVDKLSVIGKVRDWTRQLRYLRDERKMDIEPLRHKKGVRDKEYYIYRK